MLYWVGKTQVITSDWLYKKQAGAFGSQRTQAHYFVVRVGHVYVGG